MLDSQLGVASPKAAQLISVAPQGLSAPRLLQPSNSTGTTTSSSYAAAAPPYGQYAHHQQQHQQQSQQQQNQGFDGFQGRADGYPPAGARAPPLGPAVGQPPPSSPLGFLAARRARGLGMGTPPLPVDASLSSMGSSASVGGSAAHSGAPPRAPDPRPSLPGVTSLQVSVQQQQQQQQQGVSSPKMAALSRLSPQLRVRSAEVHTAVAVSAASSGGVGASVSSSVGGGGGGGGGGGLLAQHNVAMQVQQHGQPPRPWEAGGAGTPSSYSSGGSGWRDSQGSKPSTAQQQQQQASGGGASYWEKGSTPLQELTAAELGPVQVRSCLGGRAQLLVLLAEASGGASERSSGSPRDGACVASRRAGGPRPRVPLGHQQDDRGQHGGPQGHGLAGEHRLARAAASADREQDDLARTARALHCTSSCYGAWPQGQYEALNDARRLVKHHPDVVRGSLHDLVRAAAPAVDQLRSLCVKNSLNLLQEMFTQLGRNMDKELDEVRERALGGRSFRRPTQPPSIRSNIRTLWGGNNATASLPRIDLYTHDHACRSFRSPGPAAQVVPLLLKKAGDVSNAGRENWLAAEADRVLAEMCRTCGEQRVIAALCACAGHKSMHVRAKVASHLDGLLELNPGLVR